MGGKSPLEVVMKNFSQSLAMFLWLTILTGLLYPLLITGISQLTMHNKANGSFISRDGKTIGSKLISQKFESDKYFWPRPSAVDFNPLPSGGSNLGPTSAALKKAVDDRKAALAKAHGTAEGSHPPPELLYASGSGLDPHISRATAFYQIERVAKARNLDKQVVTDLVSTKLHKRQFGILGEPTINVLELNLALDDLTKSSVK